MKKKLLSTLSLIAVAFLATAAYKLRIDENGFVGIGVQIPSTKLEVSGGVTLANLGSGETPKAGTIKFDGEDFMGFDGTNWKSLTVGNSQPATIVSGENAERRAGSIRWSGDEFEGYDGENWIPFKMNITWEDGYLSLNASSLGFDLSFQEKITYEGLDFEVKGVKFLSLATDQQYLAKAMIPEGSGIPLVMVVAGVDYMDLFSGDTNVKRMSFGDLDGFYTWGEVVSIMESNKIPNFYTKGLSYGQTATVYLNLGKGIWAFMGVETPDDWAISMSINDPSDTREMVDIVPPKAERDELERKIRTIAESIKVTKI
jgi:hypothetical protein